MQRLFPEFPAARRINFFSAIYIAQTVNFQYIFADLAENVPLFMNDENSL